MKWSSLQGLQWRSELPSLLSCADKLTLWRCLGHFWCCGETWMKRSNRAPDCFETNIPLALISDGCKRGRNRKFKCWQPFLICNIFHLCFEKCYIEQPLSLFELYLVLLFLFYSFLPFKVLKSSSYHIEIVIYSHRPAKPASMDAYNRSGGELVWGL